MTHAYSESYLNNAKDRLSSFFDYAINDCSMKPDWITALFLNTGFAEQFERGNPAYLAGMSGVELACVVIRKAYGQKELPQPTFTEDCSPEYWAGWALAEYLFAPFLAHMLQIVVCHFPAIPVPAFKFFAWSRRQFTVPINNPKALFQCFQHHVLMIAKKHFYIGHFHNSAQDADTVGITVYHIPKNI